MNDVFDLQPNSDNVIVSYPELIADVFEDAESAVNEPSLEFLNRFKRLTIRKTPHLTPLRPSGDKTPFYFPFCCLNFEKLIHSGDKPAEGLTVISSNDGREILFATKGSCSKVTLLENKDGQVVAIMQRSKETSTGRITVAMSTPNGRQLGTIVPNLPHAGTVSGMQFFETGSRTKLMEMELIMSSVMCFHGWNDPLVYEATVNGTWLLGNVTRLRRNLYTLKFEEEVHCRLKLLLIGAAIFKEYFFDKFLEAE